MAIDGANEQSLFVGANDFAKSLNYTPTGGSAIIVNSIHDMAIDSKSDGSWSPNGVFSTPL
jgi:hypothetical protein